MPIQISFTSQYRIKLSDRCLQRPGLNSSNKKLTETHQHTKQLYCLKGKRILIAIIIKIILLQTIVCCRKSTNSRCYNAARYVLQNSITRADTKIDKMLYRLHGAPLIRRRCERERRRQHPMWEQ